jgi:prevent-host-death family protein
MEWQMADAKNRFSEVMNRAFREGPQRVRRRKEAVIVLAEEEYERLIGTRPDFKAYLMEGESLEGVQLSRDQSLGRDIAL